MAHSCPDCSQACYCNGDIDDCLLDDDDAINACTHCDDEGDFFEESDERHLGSADYRSAVDLALPREAATVMRNHKIETRDINGKQRECAVYAFKCEGCGAEGEIAVPLVEFGPFGCPEGCGATYIQWRPPAGGYALQCVVCPVFEEPEE